MDWRQLIETNNQILSKELQEIKSLLKMSLRVENYTSDVKARIEKHMVNFETIEFDFAQLLQNKHEIDRTLQKGKLVKEKWKQLNERNSELEAKVKGLLEQNLESKSVIGNHVFLQFFI